VFLENGDSFTLDANLSKEGGTEKAVGIDYPELVNDVKVGQTLVLADGLIELLITDVTAHQIITKVTVGGELSNNKGINLKGGGLSAAALTEKDKIDLAFACSQGVDYFAFSFICVKEDIIEARKLLESHHSHAGVIAKIERTEAVANLDEIISVSDAVMVARGDLGVEIGYPELVAVQKHMIARARALNKAVITATQMMESMIQSPIPTRAEVLDVANAVIDGTDAVMLSAETATGAHPPRVIASMHQICLGAERQRVTKMSNHRNECEFKRIDESIAMAAMYVANHLDIKAIVALTESGSTPLWMSRIRSGIPIFGLSRSANSLAKMTLYRGVYPIYFDVTQHDKDRVVRAATDHLLAQDFVSKDDRIVITLGDVLGVDGQSNSLKIISA